jgi:hypothetical protein
MPGSGFPPHFRKHTKEAAILLTWPRPFTPLSRNRPFQLSYGLVATLSIPLIATIMTHGPHSMPLLIPGLLLAVWRVPAVTQPRSLDPPRSSSCLPRVDRLLFFLFPLTQRSFSSRLLFRFNPSSQLATSERCQ